MMHSQPGPPPQVEVVIEIQRGSFLKRGSAGQLDFVSPLPCPFNYGSVPHYIGGEGDYLDAVVLGPRLPRGTQISTTAYGAIGLSERGMYDDKLICAPAPPGHWDCRAVLAFFHFYAFCKGRYNVLRGQSGHARCKGWDSAQAAIQRAVPVTLAAHRPRTRF
ncbi:MAG: inorganic diphosphatase [Gammaproteobacteria bacterium]|nr:inorganic diphosphatase [Pseudomonadales bacterium]MCP5348695.1 inorganic diphosphatase [Pseudomonadales bacterium]